MKLHELKPAEGSRKKRNRVGRGMASGNGKTSGRGHKGQNARSGGGVRRDLKEGKCRYSSACLNAGLPISTAKNMRL